MQNFLPHRFHGFYCLFLFFDGLSQKMNKMPIRNRLSPFDYDWIWINLDDRQKLNSSRTCVDLFKWKRMKKSITSQIKRKMFCFRLFKKEKYANGRKSLKLKQNFIQIRRDLLKIVCFFIAILSSQIQRRRWKFLNKKLRFVRRRRLKSVGETGFLSQIDCFF